MQMDEKSFLSAGTNNLVEEKQTQITVVLWNKGYNIDLYNMPWQTFDFINGDTQWAIEGECNI